MFHWINNQYGELLRKLKIEGSFTQNFAVLLSGNLLAQVIGFIFTPFIARLYGPSAYGLFALFIGIANNTSIFATLQFPSGYVAAKTEDELYRLIQLTFLSVLVFTFISLLSIFFFKDLFANQLSTYVDFEFVIYFLPIYLFLMSIDQIVLGLSIYMKEFRRGVVAKIAAITISKGVAVVFGLMHPTAIGIVAGNLLSYPIESMGRMSASITGKAKYIFRPKSWGELKQTFLKFSSYPFYVTPGLFISNLSAQLPVYYFSVVYNQVSVGLFALANSMVNLPLALIVNSTNSIFLQRAAETIQYSAHELARLVRDIHRKFFFVSLLPIFSLAIIGEFLFAIVFGPNWEQSGVYVSYLAMGMQLSLSYLPLSALFRLMHLEKLNFAINILFTVVKFIGLWIGVYYNDIGISIICYSLATLISHAVSLSVIFKMVGLARWMIFRDFLISISLFGIVILIKSV